MSSADKSRLLAFANNFDKRVTNADVELDSTQTIVRLRREQDAMS